MDFVLDLTFKTGILSGDYAQRNSFVFRRGYVARSICKQEAQLLIW